MRSLTVHNLFKFIFLLINNKIYLIHIRIQISKIWLNADYLQNLSTNTAWIIISHAVHPNCQLQNLTDSCQQQYFHSVPQIRQIDSLIITQYHTREQIQDWIRLTLIFHINTHIIQNLAIIITVITTNQHRLPPVHKNQKHIN